MANVQRIGDSNSGGGRITTSPASTVCVNNRVVAVDGSRGTGHGIGLHATNAWITTGGNRSVCANGIAINVTGNVDTCGHARVGGSSNVNVG